MCPEQGALLCLAAAAVGLGDPSEVHLRQIVPPVLASFTDQDARVRYYACEALYNIAKVLRARQCHVMPCMHAARGLTHATQAIRDASLPPRGMSIRWTAHAAASTPCLQRVAARAVNSTGDGVHG